MLKSLIHLQLNYICGFRGKDKISFLCMPKWSFPGTCWRRCLFCNVYFWHLCQRRGSCNYVELYLNLPCCWFCDILFLLLWLHSVIWNNICCYLMYHLFFVQDCIDFFVILCPHINFEVFFLWLLRNYCNCEQMQWNIFVCLEIHL